MKFEDFKNAVNEGLTNCPSFNVSFKQVGKYFIAIVTRKDCCFMMTQSLLDAAFGLSFKYGFQYYVDCECGLVRLKIAFEL